MRHLPAPLRSFLVLTLSTLTGSSAPLTASGSLRFADNDFQLDVDGLPLNSFGFYLNSRGTGYLMPAGSQGFLCINSGGIGRFIRRGELQKSGTLEATSLAIDLNSLPRPTGSVAAEVAEGWAFQYRFRDASGGSCSSGLAQARSRGRCRSVKFSQCAEEAHWLDLVGAVLAEEPNCGGG